MYTSYHTPPPNTRWYHNIFAYIYIYIYIYIYVVGYLLIHYYTPLPFKVANNKQATLVLSVLAITLFQRFGLYSTVAILEPRWCPYHIQLTGGVPGWGRQARGYFAEIA